MVKFPLETSQHAKGLLRGLAKWARNFVLGAAYYLFQLRTKAFGVQQVRDMYTLAVCGEIQAYY